MWIAILLSMLVGAAIVVQNGANAQMMKSTNLWLLLGAANFLAAVAAAAIFFVQRARGDVLAEIARMPAMVLIPGICGVVITAGMPVAINKLGVFNTVLLVIACQIVAGIAWDRYVSGQAVNSMQLAGAGLVFGGVLLILRATG